MKVDALKLDVRDGLAQIIQRVNLWAQQVRDGLARLPESVIREVRQIDPASLPVHFDTGLGRPAVTVALIAAKTSRGAPEVISGADVTWRQQGSRITVIALGTVSNGTLYDLTFEVRSA